MNHNDWSILRSGLFVGSVDSESTDRPKPRESADNKCPPLTRCDAGE